MSHSAQPPSPSPIRIRLSATGATLGSWVAWMHYRGPVGLVVAVAATSLACWAWVKPAHFAPVVAFVDRIVQAVLQVVTVILLFIVFVLVVIPGRLVLALRRSDPLARAIDPSIKSYWVGVRVIESASERFTRQF